MDPSPPSPHGSTSRYPRKRSSIHKQRTLSLNQNSLYNYAKNIFFSCHFSTTMCFLYNYIFKR